VLALVDAIMTRRGVEISLHSFILTAVKVLGYVLIVLIIVSILGFNSSSFLAVLASMGLAIGMALSGTLQNFAGGVVLLILRPYKVGDYIDAQGQTGVVDEIGLFQTRLRTTDNRIIYVPNSSISTSVIDNYSQSEKRRVEWILSISYGDDVDVARAAILAMLQEDSRVIKEIEPVVYVKELGDSSVDLTVRAWVSTDDYWMLYFAINERMYKELPSKGIKFPFPQMDVNIKNNK
jgi:small conductance mechanosensitive channel